MNREYKALKQALSEDTLMAFNPNLPTELHTDASERGLGAVLAQVHDEVERPVALFSKKWWTTRYATA